jgi:hypothetical protein
MPFNIVIEPGCEWTDPEHRGRCGFCGGMEGGYAKRNEKGEWTASCWPCVRPKNPPPPMAKRATIGTVYTEIDVDEPEKPKKKNPGLSPSTHRPKVN